MIAKIKKHLASVNLSLFLLACLVGAWKGIDPCDKALGHLLSVAGITEITPDVLYTSPEGPPLAADVEIKLADGRVIMVLANGGVNIK